MMHFGIMDRGQPSLRLEVVPDSAEGALAGLRGSMVIDASDGRHAYTFDYTLPTPDAFASHNEKAGDCAGLPIGASITCARVR